MIEYNPHKWTDHLLDFRGTLLRPVTLRMTVAVGWSALIALLHHLQYLTLFSGTVLHTLTGIAISLLLVFRTNASYDRYWEGRKLWGGIVNETRNLGRSSASLMHAAPDTLRRLLLWAMIFPHTVMRRLRGERGLGPVVQELPAGEAGRAEKADHQPVAVARRLSELLREGRDKGVLSDITLSSLDQNVQQLVDYLGGCERILSTPLPFAYVVHLRRALILYCFTLPFFLAKDFGYWSVLITLLVTFILFGIEEIGVEIEDPFGYDPNDLPLERICETIERNVREVLNDPA